MNYGFCLTRGDGIPARGERWGCFQRERFSVTRQDRGGGSRLRLPPSRRPLPHGGDSPIDTVPWERSSLRRQRDRPHRDPVPAPHARYPVLSPLTARPLGRGREEAAERPGGGGAPAREVFSDTMKQGRCHHPRKPFPVTRKQQGRGKVPFPPPRQPLPRLAISHRYSAMGEILSLPST